MEQAFSENALVTYLYPSAVKYFQELLDSVIKQNNQDFDFIVFYDGIQKHDINLTQMKLKLIPIEGSLIEIRFKSFDKLKALKYNKMIFTDADDTMTENRVDTVLNLLEKTALVCNDLNLMNENSEVYSKNIWKDRLYLNTKFKSAFIKDKNIVGFGSTGIRKELLDYPFFLSKKPIAADWFIFYQLLKMSDIEAVFTSKCQSNYRQHKNNDAGIRSISTESVKNTIRVKRAHYKALIELGFQEFRQQLTKIAALAKSDHFEFDYNLIPDNLFWWEETNYIK
jgi:hypothetical protein